MIFLLLALLFNETDEYAPDVPPPEDVQPEYDNNDPKIQDLDVKGINMYILVSDQNDFNTKFVREAFEIPPDILSGKIGNAKYLEEWLRAKRELHCFLVVDPTVVGGPLIKYKRTEMPSILVYPFKQIPHHVIFLKHLLYLERLSKLYAPENIVEQDTITIKFNHKNLGGPLEQNTVDEIILGVERTAFPVSPIISYRNYTYLSINGTTVFCDGPQVKEQFQLLDAGTGFLLNKKKERIRPTPNF